MKAIIKNIFLVVISVLAACKPRPPKPPNPIVEVIPEYNKGVSAGLINTNLLLEASGMGASLNFPNYLWVNNDSGDQPKVYLIDTNAQYVGFANVNEANNVDWEDMAVTKNEAGKGVIYLADTGDNSFLFNTYAIYKMDEPTVLPNTNGNVTINKIQKFEFVYPDGKKDTEAMIVDHKTKEIYVITKRDAKARVYKIPQETNKINTAIFITELPFGGANTFADVPGGATAADISQDNKEIIIKNYFQIFYWYVKKDESIETALKRNYDKILPYQPLLQDEAMAFDTNQKGFYIMGETTNNFERTTLMYHSKK